MFTVMGVTGNVGGEVARQLIAAHLPVRGVVRDAAKTARWKPQGCDVVVGDIHDDRSMTDAFKDSEAVFVVVPPVFDPGEGLPEAQSVARSLVTAIRAATPGRVVYLSTIGAQSKTKNLLSQHTLIENALRELSTPVSFLRPSWFMENCAWDVAPARDMGRVSSFLQPLDRAIPMVATADIGTIAAALLQEQWSGTRIVELEGPRRISPNDIASAFSRSLGKTVQMEVVPRESWESLFRSQGMKNPEPRIRMLDGFNEGWIAFESAAEDIRKGQVDLETVVQSLLARENAN